MLSVTAPNVPLDPPPLLKNETLKPPEESVLLEASFAVSVAVTDCPEVTEPELKVTTELARLILPGETATVGRVEVTLDELMVAVIVVAVPAVVPVKVVE